MVAFIFIKSICVSYIYINISTNFYIPLEKFVKIVYNGDEKSEMEKKDDSWDRIRLYTY